MTAEIQSVMDPAELQESLRRFDPIVTFIPVPAVVVDPCQGARHRGTDSGPDSTAVLVLKKQAKDAAGQWVFDDNDNPVYTKPAFMPVSGCCRDWETATAVRLGSEVTVHVLMIRNED